MWLISSIVVGGIAGAVAKLIIPGKDDGGIIITILLGIAGSVLMTFLGKAVGWYDEPGEKAGIISSIIGALVLLLGYRFYLKSKNNQSQ